MTPTPNGNNEAGAFVVHQTQPKPVQIHHSAKGGGGDEDEKEKKKKKNQLGTLLYNATGAKTGKVNKKGEINKVNFNLPTASQINFAPFYTSYFLGQRQKGKRR